VIRIPVTVVIVSKTRATVQLLDGRTASVPIASLVNGTIAERGGRAGVEQIVALDPSTLHASRLAMLERQSPYAEPAESPAE
jgi:hypothetical protein